MAPIGHRNLPQGRFFDAERAWPLPLLIPAALDACRSRQEAAE